VLGEAARARGLCESETRVRVREEGREREEGARASGRRAHPATATLAEKMDIRVARSEGTYQKQRYMMMPGLREKKRASEVSGVLESSSRRARARGDAQEAGLGDAERDPNGDEACVVADGGAADGDDACAQEEGHQDEPAREEQDRAQDAPHETMIRAIHLDGVKRLRARLDGNSKRTSAEGRESRA